MVYYYHHHLFIVRLEVDYEDLELDRELSDDGAETLVLHDQDEHDPQPHDPSSDPDGDPAVKRGVNAQGGNTCPCNCHRRSVDGGADGTDDSPVGAAHNKHTGCRGDGAAAAGKMMSMILPLSTDFCDNCSLKVTMQLT